MEHHKEGHFESSETIRDMVIGLADGLTVPFALAAGLSQAVNSNSLIVTAGIAEIVAGSIAMGLGGYLAGKTEIEHYASELKREFHEIQKVPELEKEEIRQIFKEYGVSLSTQNLIVDELAQDPDKWVQFMMKFELDLKKPSSTRARNQGLVIGASYAMGGILPLISYIMTDDSSQALKFSCSITIAALFLFGWLKGKVTGQKPFPSGIRMALIGALAAASAFLVTRLIQQ